MTKKNYINGTSKINLIHHQWGIGKVLPTLFLEELLPCYYNMKRHRKEDSLDNYFNFYPLSNKNDNYIWDLEVEKTFDVFDKNTVQELFTDTDNNNGGMIIEVWEKESDYRKGEVDTYEPVDRIRVAFLLGSEETGLSVMRNGKYYSVDVEEPFARFVTMREFMKKTGGERCCPTRAIQSYEGFLNLFDVEQVVDTYVKKGVKVQNITGTNVIVDKKVTETL